jgi:uncharacterized repeat protein (TIGR01451 family)
MKKYVFYLNLLKIQAMKTMKILMVLMAMVCAVGAQGQGWMRVYGESEGYCGQSVNWVQSPVITTSDGNYALLSFAGNNSFLSKVSPNGNLLWEIELELSFDVTSLSGGGFAITGPSNFQEIPLTKLASDGTVLWTKIYDPVPGATFQWGRKVLETTDGGFVIVASIYNNSIDYSMLIKTDADGNLQWTKEFNPNGIDVNTIFDLILTSDGGFAFSGQRPSFPDWGFLTKTDSNGNLQWDVSIGGTCTGLIQLPDNSFIVTGGGGDNIFAAKINEFGNIIWEKIIYTADEVPLNCHAAVSSDGLPCILGTKFFSGNTDYQILLIKLDTNGNEIWARQYGVLGVDEYSTSLLSLTNGGYLLAGYKEITGNCSGTFIINTDSLGIFSSPALTGTLHQDPESDCLPDPTEPALSGWLVQASGTQSFATLTDSFGHFTLPVDTGSYTVTIAPPGPYWEICNSPTTATITAFYDTLTFDFPAQAIAECPYLTVDISAPFLRRCFDNNYYVHYCNDGTVTANDATVEVTLDPYFTYISSTLPLASQNGNTLTFDLGDVAVNDCGSFQITAYLDCDSTVLGQTHCTLAHITPDSLCLEPDPLWDGSSIEVDVSCNGDSVTFTITNAGTGGMPAPLGFIIIEDQIVLMTGDFQLGPGQSTMVTVPANGTTLHLEAQQAAAHPSGYASTGATIEGCGGWMSLGFFTQWSFDDDPDPFTDVDCQANIGSFDPNDKQGFPTGLGDEHLIEPGQDIEYLIRFQNTGTDTAFKVTVVDVLPPELDLATVRPGASSHPYTYGVIPEGWLTFTFDNIQLPDSTTNEAASHGFIRFRASQRPGLGWGNVIANTALIYFDFNAPVQTNTYLHKVGQVFLWTVVGVPPVLTPSAWLRIMPNPMTDSAILQVEGIAPGEVTMTLTDAMGRVLRVVKGPSEGFEFRRDGLAGGLYFFKLEKDGRWLTGGKLMVK